MELVDIPASFPLYWGQNAGGSYIRNIPVNSQIGITNGAASLNDGFPPDTFQPAGAGGVPPFGQDFNGILRQITQWSQWQNAGAPVVYDGTFSSDAGGYPNGAIIRAASLPVNWQSLVDANTSDPDTGGANWIAEGGGSATIASAATVDLSTTWAKLVNVTGTTAITAFGTLPVGVMKVVVFGGILTLTYNATSMILPGAANITTAAGDVAVMQSLGAGNWKCVAYQPISGQALVPAAAGSITNSQLANMAAGTLKGNKEATSGSPEDLTGQQVRALPNISLKGYLFGLGLSNDASTPATVLDIATGEAASENTTYPTIMALPSAFTKSVNSAWAAGSGNGALDTGTFGNHTYFVFLIATAAAGAVDILVSLSPSSPTLPASYTLFRRIGAIVVQSSAILAFVQTGDDFYWNSSSSGYADYSGSAGSPTLTGLTVPVGIRVLSYLVIGSGSTVNSSSIFVADGSHVNSATSVGQGTGGASGGVGVSPAQQYTNTSGQVYVSVTGTGTVTGTINTIGWRDTRGRY